MHAIVGKDQDLNPVPPWVIFVGQTALTGKEQDLNPAPPWVIIVGQPPLRVEGRLSELCRWAGQATASIFGATSEFEF